MGLLICLMLIGCTANDSQDEVDDGVARITLRLSPTNSSTRADYADKNATEAEMMNSYIVIVVNSNNVIEKYYSGSISSSDEKEVKTIATNEPISFGKKVVYSFANMTYSDIGFTSEPQVGDAMPADFDSSTFSTQGNFTEIPAAGIPMSNRQEFTIQDNGKVFDVASNKETEATINLLVKRLYAKLKLTITNNLESNITITSLSLSDITANGENISLLPPTAAQAKKVEPLSLLSGESLPIKSTKSTESTEAGEATRTFYLNESATPKNDFGLFILDITYTAEGSSEEEVRYAMITTDEEDGDQEFSVINRNDYLEIPIVIDEYRLGLNVVDFAPIGVVTTVKAVDNYMLCNFTMPDIHFHLIPVVMKGSKQLTDFTIASSNGSYIKTIDNDGTLYATSSVSETTGSDASHNGGSPLWDDTRGFFFGKIAESPTKGASATHSIKATVNSGDITLRYNFKVEYSGR